jgi:signal transduction histidine kinase
MGIKAKTLFPFFIATFLIGLVGYATVYQMGEIAKPLNHEIPSEIESLKKESSLNSLALLVRYYEEVLAQSARNYALTSNTTWKARYSEAEPKLKDTITEATQTGDSEDRTFFRELEQSNNLLVSMEKQSIAFVDQGNSTEAMKILESKDYLAEKDDYRFGLVSYFEKRGLEYEEAMTSSTDKLSTITQENKEKIKDGIELVLFFIVLMVASMVGIGTYISGSLSTPVKQLHTATEQVEEGNFKTRVDIKTRDELEELGNTFNKMTGALEKTDEHRKQLDKAKTKLLSITSHELRSPMTPMRGQLQMLIKGYFGKLKPKQKEAATVVLRNTERLDGIIKDFLEISRIDAARLKFNFVKTDLSKNVKMLVEEMVAYLPEKKIKIIKKVSKLPTIEVDPDRTMQVLRNLLNNAKKFSPEKSTITLEVKKKDRMIQFAVKDNGIGMSPDTIKRLFEPFFQGEGTMYRKYGGTGLGLAICRGIVESQNGRIWAESKEGKGSTFYFTVPLTPVREMKPVKVLFSAKENSKEEKKEGKEEQ